MDQSRLQMQLFKINVYSPDTSPGNRGKWQCDVIVQIKRNFFLLSQNYGHIHFTKAEPNTELLAPCMGSTWWNDTALPDSDSDCESVYVLCQMYWISIWTRIGVLLILIFCIQETKSVYRKACLSECVSVTL